jgi:hypothetical protein
MMIDVASKQQWQQAPTPQQSMPSIPGKVTTKDLAVQQREQQQQVR